MLEIEWLELIGQILLLKPYKGKQSKIPHIIVGTRMVAWKTQCNQNLGWLLNLSLQRFR